MKAEKESTKEPKELTKHKKEIPKSKKKYKYHHRDLSWLSFNRRILMEAQDKSVPLYNRILFIAIYSSNLDEFFRVRVASIRSLIELDKKKINQELNLKPKKLLTAIRHEVDQQLEAYGRTLREEILPELAQNNIILYWNTEILPQHRAYLLHYFQCKILAYLQPIVINEENHQEVFLNNRELYFALRLQLKANETVTEYAYLNIPSDVLPRFIELPQVNGKYYYIFLDDVIRLYMASIFPMHQVVECQAIKLNKDADLNIEDEYSGDLIDKISKQIKKRNIGAPSRFLYDAGTSDELRDFMARVLGLHEDDLVAGGRYHNLNDLTKLPNPVGGALKGPRMKGLSYAPLEQENSIFDVIAEQDHLLHFPYYSYDYVLRFFNEAAIDPRVVEINATFYRIASDSVIANALISAARNGKLVKVFFEVKARFDEANNLRWAERLKKAGIEITYSLPGLKVHAKVAMVKQQLADGGIRRFGFLGTGNFNEVTAGIYADHGLLTCHSQVMEEIDCVFKHLYRKSDTDEFINTDFKHILVSQFNLQPRFVELIARETENAKKGLPAKIVIKLNNLEDPVMIDKLYEASMAGVKIDMVVRGICCLVPEHEGISENIRVVRVVDGFLEHARVWVFHNNGNEEMFMGSADWMRRNLYHRIEVVFPVYDEALKGEVNKMLEIQLTDNTSAVRLDSELTNVVFEPNDAAPGIRSQRDYYQYLKEKLAAAFPEA